VGEIDHVALQARLGPERLAAVDLESGRRWTYAALDRDVARCAGWLCRLGCIPGDRVASLAKNHVALLILHLACARTGAIYTPLSHRLSRREVEGLVVASSPRLFIGDERLPDRRPEDLSIQQLLLTLEAEAPLGREPVPDRPSLLLFTSGTTGHPKGALLNERNLAETAFNFGVLGRVRDDSVFLCDAPMFHVIGLVSNTRPALAHGGACLVSDGFDAGRTLARLMDPALGITHWFGVPQMAAALRAEPSYDPARLRRLTALFTGGAPQPDGLTAAFLRDGLLLVQGYGMTEVGAVFGMPIDPAIVARRPRSVGVATPRVRTRIVDDEGRQCPPGVAGELLVRGDNVFVGYLGDPESTRAAVVDGWFRTGDVVRMDEDGFHEIVDRKKDMFISGGENVYPAEIEACLAGMDGIAEAAVVGVPDDRWGEVGHLAFVAAPDVVPSVDAILERLAERLARFKLPKHVTQVQALPRTPGGKVRKGELREKLRRG
jgi:fatty-acyl-CoA synthase